MARSTRPVGTHMSETTETLGAVPAALRDWSVSWPQYSWPHSRFSSSGERVDSPIWTREGRWCDCALQLASERETCRG